MDFYVENEIPMSAQELWRTMHTPEFDAFVAREYGLYAYIELERQVSDNMLKRRVRIVDRDNLRLIASRGDRPVALTSPVMSGFGSSHPLTAGKDPAASSFGTGYSCGYRASRPQPDG